jgi:hypothetical protein
VLLFVAAVLAPFVVRGWVPEALWPWSLAIGMAVAISVALSVAAWRRGADAAPLAPLASACVFGLVVAYGIFAPVENHQRSHRLLARKLEQVLPSGASSIRFFNEIDEGLWFYLTRLELFPVPGTQPRYNTAYDLASNYLMKRGPSETLIELEAKRQARDRQALVDWVSAGNHGLSFVLIRSSLYDRYATDLGGRAIPVLRETGMKRNELVLLQVAGQWSRTASTTATTTSRR